jgi:hypothetical protein
MTKKSGFSIGYKLNGQIFCNKNLIETAQPLKVGDVVGCGINYSEKYLFFTYNSRIYGRLIRTQALLAAFHLLVPDDRHSRQELHDKL